MGAEPAGASSVQNHTKVGWPPARPVLQVLWSSTHWLAPQALAPLVQADWEE